MKWTIDTCVVITANSLDVKGESCKNFLVSIVKGHRAAIDPHTKKEYERNIKRSEHAFAEQWYNEMWARGKFDFHSSRHCHAEAIRSVADNFPHRIDPDDIFLVLLCLETRDKHLISVDVKAGDFDQGNTKALKDKLKICFHDISGESPFHHARHGCTRRTKSK